MSGTTLDNVTTSRSYNAFGELDLESASAGGTVYQNDVTLRDSLGRILQRSEIVDGSTVNTVYTYEPLSGRLDTVTVNGVLTYDLAYDANGNRLHAREDLGGLPAVHDDQDRLLDDGTFTYTYTAAGDLDTRTEIATQAVTDYDYDALGNLTRVSLPGGPTIDYVVDGANRRIGKKVGGTFTRRWVYGDALNPVAEVDGSGVVVARFVYGTQPHVPDYVVKGGVTYRILTDHLGSVRLVVDASSGAVVQQIDYDAFGKVTNDTNPGFQPFGFAGGLYDPDTDLVRFGARDYDPQTGRWTAKDPIRFGGSDSNLYTYAVGDPNNVVDPTGRFGLAGAAIGAVSGGVGAAITSGGSVSAIVQGAAVGALVGALNPFASSVAGAAVGAAASSASGQITGNLVQGRSPLCGFSPGAVVGAAAGGAFGAGTNLVGGAGGAVARALTARGVSPSTARVAGGLSEGLIDGATVGLAELSGNAAGRALGAQCGCEQ